CLVEDERHETLRSALIRLCIELRPLDGPLAVTRTDPASGFTSLVDDKLLLYHRLGIEVGRIKNMNKNPLAEKAIRELEDELLRQEPMGGAVTSLSLAIATARLNYRVRNRGLLAKELLVQRDQFSNQQISVSDLTMMLEQQKHRIDNHPHSERSKAPGMNVLPSTEVAVGDLVYIHADRTKSKARDRYLVVYVEDAWYNIRKCVGSQLRNTSYR
ncbi:hypothetical protein LSAT2_008376, partial [Lamellibrachia satsuma]